MDSAVLASLIHSIQTEQEQRAWLEQRAPKEVIESLFIKSEKERAALDKAFIRLYKKVKEK